MSAACLRFVYVIGLALAPIVGSHIPRDCDGCFVNGQISQADGSMLDLVVGDAFGSSQISGQEPQSASGSWDFIIVNPGGFDLHDGACGPLTPGPGCTGSSCQLVCTNPFEIQLRDKQPLPGSGTTSPTPGSGWGGQSGNKWTWKMVAGEIKPLSCNVDGGEVLDLSIQWTHGGAARTFTLKFWCTQCVDLDA